MIENRRMFVQEVAAYRGTCVSSARKWLAALERRGSAAVKRDGRKLFTTEDALRAIEPRAEAVLPEERLLANEEFCKKTWRSHTRLAAEVKSLAERVAELEAGRHRASLRHDSGKSGPLNS